MNVFFKNLTLFFAGCASLLLVVFVYSERVFGVGPINPNLLLILFLLILFGYQLRTLFFFWLLVLLIVGLLWFPFWFPSFVVLAVVLGTFGVFRFLFTGTAFFDFLLALVSGTLFLYGLSSFIAAASWDTFMVFQEILYNILLGAVLWIFIRERGSFKGLFGRRRASFL